MRVLVTNATSPVGSALVEQLHREPAIEHVLAVEPYEIERPRSLHDLLFGPGRTLQIDTVVHDSSDPEVTRNLLLGCERHPTIRRLVYRSTGDVYRRSTMEPNLLDEGAALDFDRAATDLTVCARAGMSSLSIAVLRCAEVLVPGGELWDYLQSRVCLRPLGFDPMINLLSLDDQTRALVLAMRSDATGIFNIPGADTLPLSRVIALAGRRDIPLPGPLLAPLYNLRTRLVGFEFRYDRNMQRFHFGGILDGTRARRLLGYVARHLLRLDACGRSPSRSAFSPDVMRSEPSKTSAI